MFVRVNWWRFHVLRLGLRVLGRRQRLARTRILRHKQTLAVSRDYSASSSYRVWGLKALIGDITASLSDAAEIEG